MQVVGKSFADVASLVDETDRRSLGDPVRKALATGGRITMGKRAVLVPANAAMERSVEISVTPLKSDAKETLGLVLVLHDTSELRGLTRQMSYQASHDALTGLVNRREFERRLHEAMDSAQTGDAAHALCYLDLDRFKVVNDTCGHTAGDNMLREIATITQRSGARFGHGRAHRRRRIRAAAGGLPAREGAADRRRRGALGQRLSLRLEGQDLQRRREHRPRGDRARRRLDRGHHEFGRFRLLRRQEAGRRARARVFRA